MPTPDPTDPPRHAGRAALTVAALGVVFGDLGTSPLYSLNEVFDGPHPISPTHANVYGVISLVFWALMIVVTFKYVTLIMRADNHGEGGIMALLSLAERRLRGPRARLTLVVLGVFGASLFAGDAIVTPAISVLSAAEGLEVVSPSLGDVVIPITCGVLVALFALQRFGSSAVGTLFGPIMLLWFCSIAVAGAPRILDEPEIVRAISPSYAVQLLVHDPVSGFLALGGVVLVLTGAEALYADMGHFGRAPIRRAWLLVVMPALVVQYLGEGALALRHPEAAGNLFFRVVPDWAQLPMVFLATVATVIASQSVISGAFSMARQAVQLGFLPRLQIRHTSEHEIGQIYVPAVNAGLLVAVLGLVLGFRSSSHLASAYGIAVTGTMSITTLLAFPVSRRFWGWSRARAALVFSPLLVIDVAFFASNLTKVVHGGWFPLLVAAVVFTVLMTWRRGREIVTRNRTEQEGSLLEFVRDVDAGRIPVTRVPGTAICLNANGDTTPFSLRYNAEHNKVMHELVLVVTVETLPVPHVVDEDRLVIDDLSIPDDGVGLVTCRFGFKDDPNVPAALRLAADQGLPIEVDEASYFLSRITIHPTSAPGLAAWRKRLFVAISRNAASPVDYFRLPAGRVVSVGAEVDV
jgi:KUP system potassium uptake protein